MLEVVRVRLADGEPLSLERALFPAERFPGLLDRSLGGSLYELLETALRPRARRGGGAHRGGGRRRRRGAAARAAPGRAAAGGRPHGVGRRRPPVRALARPLPRRPRRMVVRSLPRQELRWLNLESRRTTSSARDRVEEKGTHGHHQAGPRGRRSSRGHRRVGICRGLGRRPPEAQRHRAVGGDLRRR